MLLLHKIIPTTTVPLTVAQVAQAAKVRRCHLVDAIASGELKARRLGKSSGNGKFLIVPQDLEAWVQQLPLAKERPRSTG